MSKMYIAIVKTDTTDSGICVNTYETLSALRIDGYEYYIEVDLKEAKPKKSPPKCLGKIKVS